MFRVKNKNTIARWEICSKLAIKTPELVSSIVNFGQVNAGWDVFLFSSLLMKCKCDPNRIDL